MNTFEIKGKLNSAKCFTTDIEEEAVSQIMRMCNYEISKGSTIRIMPDVHAGAGCTIGTTMTISDKVVPNIVGVDIGCGMYAVNLGKINLDLEKLDKAVHIVPAGHDVRFIEAKDKFLDILNDLICVNSLSDMNRLRLSLGTLGGGNHFIEIDEDSNGNFYLVIHSGSRNLGKQVAELYQKQATKECNELSIKYSEEKDAMIASLKSQGKQKEIPEALIALKNKYKNTIPDDLCYVSGQSLKDYLHDMKICQEFAIKNRETMSKTILNALNITPKEAFHTVHNYIDLDNMIIRKGAIAAYSGQPLLIPLNMRDGSIIGTGKGNEDWNCSAPHGAGRIMSRSKAKDMISLEEYKESMEGIYSSCINTSTIDESPMAYKPAQEIIDSIKDTVEIEEIIKPVYNFKASE